MASEEPEDRTIRISVRGGVVQDVENIPEGWNYEIIDYDDLAAGGGSYCGDEEIYEEDADGEEEDGEEDGHSQG